MATTLTVAQSANMPATTAGPLHQVIDLDNIEDDEDYFNNNTAHHWTLSQPISPAPSAPAPERVQRQTQPEPIVINSDDEYEDDEVQILGHRPAQPGRANPHAGGARNAPGELLRTPIIRNHPF